MQCVQCGAQIPDDTTVCSQCGAEVASLGLSREDAAREIYSLLAAANLARIRREYEEATARCIEVMRRFPNNASAHSLMGDIYADQGLLRDAAEWYKIAIELDPSSRADRAKLDALLSRMRARPEEAPAAPSPVARAIRALGLSSPLAVGMAVTLVTLLALLIGAVAYQRATLGRAALPTSPTVGAPTRPTVGPRRLPTLAPTPAAPAASIPPQVPQALSPEDKMVSALRVGVASTLPASLINWVALDPRNSSVTIAFQVGRQDTMADVKRAILRAAQQIGRVAFRHDSSLAAAVLRGYAVLPQTAAGPPELVFIGQTESARLIRLPANDPSPSDIEGAFADVWWNAALRDLTL
jgi:tetratricopeptide (TPR) repeat protein